MNLTRRQIKQGFWYHSRWRRFPPKSITRVDEYKRGERLNVVCTQLSVNKSEQRRIVKEWCDALPCFSHVKYLWFSSRVSQPMFDAACSLRNLEGLYVKWSGVKTISALTSMPRLKYLHIGNSAQLESIDCLSQLGGLLVLELEWIKKIKDLSPIGSLCQLEGLAVEGNMYSTQVVESLAPLSPLSQLRYLFLANLKSLDGTLRPLCNLKSLVNLQTAFWWSEDDFAILRETLPNLKYGTPFDKLPSWAAEGNYQPEAAEDADKRHH